MLAILGKRGAPKLSRSVVYRYCFWGICRHRELSTMRLAQARLLLAMPAANEQAQEDAEAFMKRVRNVEINTCAH
jgi:hypothetical protein